MKPFQDTPVTSSELEIWKNKPAFNPRTGRPINEKGKVYLYLQKEFQKLENNNRLENKLKLEDSIDDRDPISLAVFWIIENHEKKIIYNEIDKLLLYKDNRGFTRCFEKESLEYMKAHKINKHPVSLEDIPEHVWSSIIEKNLEDERSKFTIKERSFEIFQKFSTLSIFIDSEWFTSLEKSKLLKFYYEIKDFYNQNFNSSQKKEISSRKLFSKSEDQLNNNSKDEILNYLLDEMDVLLTINKEELKYMANYILVGALGIVIPQIDEMYPDFSYSFNH